MCVFRTKGICIHAWSVQHGGVILTLPVLQTLAIQEDNGIIVVSRALLASNPTERREGSWFPVEAAALSLFKALCSENAHGFGDPMDNIHFTE